MSAAAPASAPAPDTTTSSRPWHARLRFGTGDRAAAALLLLFTVIAILWANSPWGDSYERFWETPVEIGVGDMLFVTTFHHFVNDAVMTLFFFVVGLEVKREFTLGELTDRARAVVPVVAAVAGLIVPALIFVLIAWPTGEAHAWGVVISTDTAFLLGALAIIGPRFPARLRAFLLTLAVVDDIGALLAIAIFYNSGIQVLPLVVAAVLMVLIALVRFLPAWRGIAYATLGIALWFAIAAAGVHPTLAGVAVALLIPVFPPRRTDVERSAELTQAFRESPNAAYAAAVTRSLRNSISINDRLQAAWGPYISFIVLPLFALANAGVHLDAETVGAAVTSPLTWGIVAGLVIGKFIGIAGATALIRMTGLGRLAPGLAMPRIAGGAALSGIGFTIALFIVTLAIADPETQDLARVGVLVASVIAFSLGWAIFAVADRLAPPQPIGKILIRPLDPERDHYRGRPDAPHQIVEYGDFECPFCSRATGSIDAVIEHFGDDVCWVWRHLPLEAVHSHAKEAAQAYEAAALQGRFLEMSRIMFANQDALTADDLCRYAKEIDLDVDRFIDDMRSPHVTRRVEEDQLDAEMMDLHSTPTFFIGGKRHIGPWDSRTLIRTLEASAAPRVEPAP
ncbi:Na+/H+ antiporter NhaA [Agromyces flavus]|uniref:Na(+)/H(+) antiporter NhaA n=1 Tax=Agromyces flavus TaxID=589382 RepID=A0A1H1WIE5_9MICO|nr:Na+/H+ antiporter NhaA [Agromyces flavus]MCP2366182.1 Na+/H+ antiporter NhaA [Agromyces flavus]GGI44164.1 Na(+)/H(+) antiporter NhaA 2 [Agromyces flavus]SDS96893.1 Na+/H+ antiporter NhaA [Agromyces flavus]